MQPTKDLNTNQYSDPLDSPCLVEQISNVVLAFFLATIEVGGWRGSLEIVL